MQRVHCMDTWVLLLVPSLGLRCAHWLFQWSSVVGYITVLHGTLLCTLVVLLPIAYSVPICAVVLCAIRLSRAVHSPQSKETNCTQQWLLVENHWIYFSVLKYILASSEVIHQVVVCSRHSYSVGTPRERRVVHRTEHGVNHRQSIDCWEIQFVL